MELRELDNFKKREYKKPINCVGKKGRSGRKCAVVEVSKSRALDKAWKKAEYQIDNKADVLGKQQFDIVKTLTSRSVPQEVEHSGGIVINIVDFSKEQNGI